MGSVSIPFKREGTCEQVVVEDDLDPTHVSIPFKREGTCERLNRRGIFASKDAFQFPSNGKARVNTFAALNVSPGPSSSFNSLQTGRHV